MWQKKVNVAAVKIKFSALSLLEVLISSTLGAFLIFFFASSYTDFYRNQIKQKERISLQFEAHQLLHYFQQHFQHIGYQASKRTENNFDLFLLNGKSVNIPHKNCLISFYDLNQDGCLGKRKTKTAACKIGEVNNTQDLLKEIFGFKLENQEIYTFSTNLDNCLKPECEKLLTLCNGNWNKLTEKKHFNVNKLEFSWGSEDRLLVVELELLSAKDKDISYSAKSKIFLLN